ncbi:MAG: HAMP domain-containing histidine kinase [Bacteroidales bacterium]|nr:HAMP domain-containing histidine kinase [Bacteroidales bacterium]
MYKFLQYFKTFMNIQYPGSSKTNYTSDDIRRYNLVNYIALISGLTIIIYVIICSVLDFQLFRHAVFFLSICSITTFGIIFINKSGHYKFAKLFIAVFFPVFLTYFSTVIFSKNPGFHVFLLLSAFIPLFMWSSKEKKYFFIFIPINIFLYLIIEFFPPFFIAEINLPLEYITLLKSTNIIICFMCFGLAIGIYQVYANNKEKQLFNQKEKLRISQAHKDKIHSIIAHDIRGPVEGFSSITEYLIENYENFNDEKKMKFLNEINKSMNSIKSLLENLLDWSKAHSDLIKKNFTDIKVLVIIQDVIKLLNNQIKKKKIIIDIDITPEIQVNAYSHMVSTIFRNLIFNAIKYTPDNGNISISADKINSKVKFCIADSGVGMSESDIIKVFNFQKIYTTLGTNNEKGSGFGLLLCKEFIEKNNGEIWVETELGKGSKFYFTLNGSLKEENRQNII